MKKVYFVICDAIKGDPTWDTFIGAYKTFDAAKAVADFVWNNTSDSDRKNRILRLTSAKVPRKISIADAFGYIKGSTNTFFVEDEYFIPYEPEF